MGQGKWIYNYDDGTLYHHKYRDRYMGPSGKWVYVYDDGSMSSKASTKKINKPIPKPVLSKMKGEKMKLMDPRRKAIIGSNMQAEKMKLMESKKKKKHKLPPKSLEYIPERDSPSGGGTIGSSGNFTPANVVPNINNSSASKEEKKKIKKKKKGLKAAPIFVKKGNLMNDRKLIKAKNGKILRRSKTPEPKNASEMLIDRVLKKRKK